MKKINSNYFLSFPNTPAIPHEDGGEYNCLIYIVGDKLINNGTGFYEKLNNKYHLHTHIGFKENRAIFFNSQIDHSSLQFAGNSTPRYVMANFCYVIIKYLLAHLCYGNMLTADYFKSCLQLTALAATKKVELQFGTIGNESLVTRAS